MESFFKPKLITVLKQGITREQLIKDIFAGIIVGIVALPLAIAFAVASGVSPEKGLITAIVAGFLISALGGSRVQIGGPTGAFIVIVYGIVAEYGLDGLLLSTIMAGVLLILFGILRLGSLLKFFPHPLVVGFTSGIALIIFSSQIKDALGLSIDKLPADFLGKWHLYFTHLDGINLTALALTIATILITVNFKKVSTVIPGSFVAILLITSITYLFDLNVATIGSLYGTIPNSFSISIPEINWSNIGYYFSPAITIALLGGIESLLSAVVADGMIGSNHRSNTELIAQGIANIVTPLFGGIPATGAIARTATNIRNGARTPIAGMVHAITLLLIMLAFGKYASLIPMSCLAGVLIVVAYNMSEWRSFVGVLRGELFDILVLLTTFFLTVLLDLTVAIQVGVVLSALLFMKRMADLKPDINRSVDADVMENYAGVDPRIGIYEISGPFFFASAKEYGEIIRSLGQKYKVLIIRMRHVPFIDHTGVKNLREAIRSLQNAGIKVILSGVNPNVAETLQKERITFLVGKANQLPEFSLALKRANEVLSE